jgi:hypothetical protein
MDMLTDKLEIILNDHQETWCECTNEDAPDWIFIDDDVHPTIGKHHWRCSKCLKITQIG